MAVAGVYYIVFKVTNSKGMSASVSRTLVVQPVCSSGEVLCPNKVGWTLSSLPCLCFDCEFEGA